MATFCEFVRSLQMAILLCDLPLDSDCGFISNFAQNLKFC